MSDSGPSVLQTQFSANMPGAATPMVDLETGAPTTVWWLWATKIFARTGGPKGIGSAAAVVQVVSAAALPAVALASERGFVNDALAPVWGAVVVPGGNASVPVYFDGLQWRVG